MGVNRKAVSRPPPLPDSFVSVSDSNIEIAVAPSAHPPPTFSSCSLSLPLPVTGRRHGCNKSPVPEFYVDEGCLGEVAQALNVQDLLDLSPPLHQCFHRLCLDVEL